jgi:hypothetical protein
MNIKMLFNKKKISKKTFKRKQLNSLKKLMKTKNDWKRIKMFANKDQYKFVSVIKIMSFENYSIVNHSVIGDFVRKFQDIPFEFNYWFISISRISLFLGYIKIRLKKYCFISYSSFVQLYIYFNCLRINFLVMNNAPFLNFCAFEPVI